MPPRSLPALRLLLPASLVLLGVVGFASWRASSAGEVQARGAFWTARTRAAGVLRLPPPITGLPLQAGRRLEIQPGEGDGTRFTSLAFRAQRTGQQSSHLDLRFRDRGSDSYRLVIVPGEPLVAFLSRRTEGESSTQLARAEHAGALADPLAPFDLEVELQPERILARVNGRPVLEAEHASLPAGRVTLWADGILLLHARVEGSSTGTTPAFPWVQDFAQLGAAARARSWTGAALALAALLAAAAWLRGLCSGPAPAAQLLRATLALWAPPALVFAWTLVAPLPAPALGPALAVTGIAGLLLALRALRPQLGPPAAPARTPLLLLVLAVALTGWAVERAVHVRARNLGPALQAARDALDRPTPAPHHQDTALTLDASNALSLPGPYRSLDLRARVTLQPGSLLELRLRGHPRVAEGLALVLSADERVATSFVSESDTTYRPVGSASAALPGGQAHDLLLHARGTRFEAWLDGAPLASAGALEPATGSVVLLAAAGSVEVADLELLPFTPEPPPPSLFWLCWPAAGVPLLLLLGMALLARRWLGRPLARGLGTAAFALLPLALGFDNADDRGRLGAEAWAWTALATTVVLGALALALQAGRGGGRPGRFAALSLLAGPAALAAVVGAPLRADAGRGPSYADFELPRLVDGLLHLQHPLLRRFNTWLTDHRFRDRRFALRPPEGTARVVCMGSSSTWGHGIPEASGQDYPTVLEGLLREAEPGRKVEVINGAIRGSTSARLLRFFHEVILRYEPDVVTLSLFYNDSVHDTLFDEDAYLSRVSQADYEHGPLERMSARRRLARGQRAVSALFAATSSGNLGCSRAWEEVGAADERTPPQRFEANLRAFAELAARDGVRLVLVQEPVRGAIRHLWKPEFYAVIERVGREFGLPVLRLPEILGPEPDASLFMDEVHPLPAGHRRIAQELLTLVRTQLPDR